MSPAISRTPRRSPLRLWLLVASAALAPVSLPACSGQARSPEGGHPLLGQRAPSFDIPAQSGASRASLPSGQAGQAKVTVVDFWATWCEPCKRALRHYQSLADRYPGQVTVVGVSEDDEVEAVAPFASSLGVRFPLGWDGDKSLAQAYSLGAMPSTFIIDANGVVRHVHNGFTAEDERAVDQEIAALLPSPGRP